MIDLRSWRTKWNDAELPQIPMLPGESPSRLWPMLGMLAVGLAAGAALGGYAFSQRSQMNRLAMHAHRIGDELEAMGTPEAAKPVAATTSSGSNHRRRTASTV